MAKPKRGPSVLYIYIAALLLIGGVVGYSLSLVSQMEQAKAAWLAFNREAMRADHSMHVFREAFGYGGFIHNFKNLVLRRDLALLPQIERDLANTLRALGDYENLSATQGGRGEVARLRGVVERYAANVAVARRMIEQGAPVAAIDARVKVDDQPGLEALAALDALQVDLTLTQRERIDQELATFVRQLELGLLLAVPLVLAAGWIVGDRRRILTGNDELEQARRYVEDLVEGVPDALLVTDRDGRILRANVAAEQLFGYKRELLVGMTVEDLMPAHFRGRHQLVRTEAVERGAHRPMAHEMRFLALTADGREVPVEISLSYSAQPEGTQALVTLRNVADREALMRLAEERQSALQAAQAIAHIGSWDWRIQTDELAWSDEIYRIFGVPLEQTPASYERFLGFVHPDDRELLKSAVERTLASGEAYEIEHRIVRPDGVERVVQEKAQLFRDQAGQPVRMIGTVLDITERKQAELALQFDKAIIDGISQPVVVVDEALRIVDVNKAYSNMSGYGCDELIGNAPAMLKSGRHDKRFYEEMWADIKAWGSWHGEIWIRRKDGEIIPRLLSITRICVELQGVCRYVGFYSDITSLKESEARLEKLAHFDQLTGVANRMLFHDRLRAAMKRAHRAGSRVGVMFVDLDGFKAVNDSLGHHTGDELLIQVAERMTECVREDDTVARFGGDEFALVLNELADEQAAEELATRVLNALRITLDGPEGPLRVSGSIGIALYPEHGTAVRDLLARADRAMYRAKQAGKDGFVFWDGEKDLAAEPGEA